MPSREGGDMKESLSIVTNHKTMLEMSRLINHTVRQQRNAPSNGQKRYNER